MANRTYLLSLSSGNIAPIMIQQGDTYVGVDTEIDALLNLTSESVVAPRYRIFILNSDDTIQEEIPLEDLLSSGSYSENYQNGQRCSLSLTLYNQEKKYLPTINKLWAGTKLRLDAGIEYQDSAILWVQKGVFVITSVQPSYGPDNKLVSISAGDKFSELEQGVGLLSEAWEIESGYKISSIVKELLSIQRGNGIPIDSQDPWFHPKLINKVTQAKISKNAGDSIGSIILDLTKHMSAEVFYNAQGRLCFFPIDATADDNDKPILYNYLAEKGELTSLDLQLDYSNIINKIILIGATVNGGVVKADASNNDPFSPLCVQRIGVRTSVINESDIKTKIIAEENARYQLRKNLVLKTSVSLSPPFNPLFGVNNLIMVTDDFYGLEKQYFLIQSISFNLDYSNNLSMTVSNLNNLPFISSYRTNVLEEDHLVEVSSDDSNLISYKISVNIENGECNGVRTIYKNGKVILTIVPDENASLPAQINVTGSHYEYDALTGKIILFNPTSEVNISINCVTVYRDVPITVINGGPNGSVRIGVGGIESIQLIPSSGYSYPISSNDIIGNNISINYNPTTGVITASNPNVNASISTEMPHLYTINTSAVTNGIAVSDGLSGNGFIREGETVRVTITPNTGYKIPSSTPSVTNATIISYNSGTGVLVLANSQGNVSITVSCPAKTYSLGLTVHNGRFTNYPTPTLISYNGRISLQLKANSNYTTPDITDIIVTGASIVSYSDAPFGAEYDKVLEIEKNIEPDTNVAVRLSCIRIYSLNITINGGIASGAPASTIGNENIEFTIITNTGMLPGVIDKCVGCSYVYDSSTGKVTLSNIVNNVTFIATCDSSVVNIMRTNCILQSADSSIHNEEYNFTIQGDTSYSTMYGTQYSYLVTGSGTGKSIRDMVNCSIVGQELDPVGGVADRQLFTKLNITGSSPSLSVYAVYKPVVLKAVARDSSSYNISSNQSIEGRTYSYDQDGNSSDGWVDINGIFHYYIAIIYPNGTITNVTGGSTTPTLRTSSEVRNIIYNRTSLADPYTYDCQCAIYECTTPANGSRIITHTITASNFSTDTVTFVANIVREGDVD